MLDYLYERLAEKQEQQRRLITCKSRLDGSQDEFINYTRLCTEPELSPDTWHGKWASEFDDLRREGILFYYKDLGQRQLENAISTVENAISRIDIEMEDLRERIAYQKEQERLEREREMERRRVK